MTGEYIFKFTFNQRIIKFLGYLVLDIFIVYIFNLYITMSTDESTTLFGVVIDDIAPILLMILLIILTTPYIKIIFIDRTYFFVNEKEIVVYKNDTETIIEKALIKRIVIKSYRIKFKYQTGEQLSVFYVGNANQFGKIMSKYGYDVIFKIPQQ